MFARPLVLGRRTTSLGSRRAAAARAIIEARVTYIIAAGDICGDFLGKIVHDVIAEVSGVQSETVRGTAAAAVASGTAAAGSPDRDRHESAGLLGSRGKAMPSRPNYAELGMADLARTNSGSGPRGLGRKRLVARRS
jgi:hypothetical protein